MNGTEVVRLLVNLGGATVIAAGIIYALYKLADKFGGRFIDAQQAQAKALLSQATSMESLQKSLHDFVAKDNGEHREMLVLMKYTAQHIQALLEMKQEHDSCRNCLEERDETKPVGREKQTDKGHAPGAVKNRVPRNARSKGAPVQP